MSTPRICPVSHQECTCEEVNPMCAVHAAAWADASSQVKPPDMGDNHRTKEVWTRLAASNHTEEEWITEFWALAMQLERELHIAHERMLNNPWCESCKEPDCCVSGDGTCAMIRKYLSLHNS